MPRIEEVLKQKAEELKKANARYDPVVDSWLQRVLDSPYTPLFVIGFLLVIIVGPIIFKAIFG